MSVSIQSTKTYSIDEYRKAIIYLKQKFKKYEQTNINLMNIYSQQRISKNQYIKNNLVEYSTKLNTSTLKIQALFRGIKARNVFKQRLMREQQQEIFQNNINTNTLNFQVMHKIYNFFKQNYGLTLEQIFRALDYNNKKIILCEDLKIFLQQYQNLKITPSQIMRIIFILDEECTGVIRKENYFIVLSSYGLSTERYQDSMQEQQFLCEIVEKFQQKQLQIQNVCNALLNQNQNIDINDFYDFLNSVFQQELTLIQKESLKNIFLMELRQTQISKDQFQATLHKGFNSLKTKQSQNELQQQNNKPETKLQLKSKNFQKQDQHREESGRQNLSQQEIILQNQEQFKTIFYKLDESSFPVYRFLEEMLQNINFSKRNLNIKDILNSLENFYPNKLSQKEKGLINTVLQPEQDGSLELAKQLFNDLDQEKNGKIQGTFIKKLINTYRKDKQNPLKASDEEKQKSIGFIQLKEMKKFKQLLSQYGIHFKGIWRLASPESKPIGTSHLKDIIMQKTKNQVNEQQIIYWLDLIDVNRNGLIEYTEWELSTATDEEDLSARRSQSKINKQIQFFYFNYQLILKAKMSEQEKKDVLNNFFEALDEKEITPTEFFNFSDIDGDKEINLIELKNGLAAINVDLDNLLKLLEIFDKNIDGTITIQEYMEVVGEKYESSQQKDIKTIFGAKKQEINKYDARAEFGVNRILDNFGEEETDELLIALQKLKKFCLKENPNMNIAYQKLFKEFDTNMDMQLSRAEFLQGLDNHDKDLLLTNRQKIRLMETADKDKNDMINFQEFITIFEKIKLDEENSNINKAKQYFKGAYINAQETNQNIFYSEEEQHKKDMEVMNNLSTEQKPLYKLILLQKKENLEYDSLQMKIQSLIQKQIKESNLDQNYKSEMINIQQFLQVLEQSEQFNEKEINHIKIQIIPENDNQDLFDYKQFKKYIHSLVQQIDENNSSYNKNQQNFGDLDDEEDIHNDDQSYEQLDEAGNYEHNSMPNSSLVSGISNQNL
ncbi:hypothetical protein PPERSA_00512 [Pseudocohnilembus persalinus]|uniref:EF-hand domain-containing protein n=1 Tax=Pseudocohnilembus persalinus TaxID=266149 RepID=A0A0V0QI42_PSEPJ|nr:hypothetical protein PPERSA_00512 [Pseudocohnilembus persalinus]|eukprot:KRX01802.1 hypothetical protein PPERSA_00512 [Pseudocohnilembus persalinus]